MPQKRKKQRETRATNTDANMEQDISHEPLAEENSPRFNSPVCINFIHVRRRLTDIDNLSGKAAIDGLVRAGILADDSPEQVSQVSHTQVKGDIEKTVIWIEEVGDEQRT